MRRGGPSASILAISISISASTVALNGCGDAPRCAGPVELAFEPGAIADGDAAVPGLQSEIALATTLSAGEQVSLDIADATGATIEQLSAAADASGRVVFASVSLPPPRATLHATAQGLCGLARAARAFDVPGTACALTLAATPMANAFYAPRGVLNEQSDPDPATPGYQTTLRIATLSGWTAELFETTAVAASERSLGVFDPDAHGVVTVPVTMLDGPVGFRAVCRGAGSEHASELLALLADTTPPTCAQLAPAQGSTITPAFDLNVTLNDGIQLAFIGHADASDVTGEPASWTLTAAGGAPVALGGGETDGSGTQTLLATLPVAAAPTTYDVALTMPDHAGNACTSHASYTVVTDGCDLAVTAPTGVVTRDVDDDPSNGGQVDVSLAVATACAGSLVTSTCGLNAPSGFVSPQGRITLRAQLCASSPCHARASCTFRVTKPGGSQTQTTAPIELDDRVM